MSELFGKKVLINLNNDISVDKFISSMQKLFPCSTLIIDEEDQLDDFTDICLHIDSIGLDSSGSDVREDAVDIPTIDMDPEEQKRSKFIASMSHDFRTPLHGILSIARIGGVKVGKATDEKLIEYFSVIEESGNKLQKKLDDLIDAAKLDCSFMEFDFQNCDIASIIKSQIDTVSDYAEDKGVVLEFKQKNISETLYIDKIRISQAINNILKNAISSSSEGDTVKSFLETITISEKLFTEIIVSDSRGDVDEDYLNKLFEKFAIINEGSRSTEGHSLELPIAKDIIYAHNGDINVIQTPVGLDFIIRIPVDEISKQ